MDPSTLSSSLDLVASACGQTLAVDHKAAVETSLALLKKVCPENNPALPESPPQPQLPPIATQLW